MLSPEKTLIVTDLDGTFLGAASELLPRNLEALARFRQEGGRFTLATGRLPINLVTIPTPEALVNAPAIFGNGSCLFDCTSRTPVLERKLPLDTASELIDFAEREFPTVQYRGTSPRFVFFGKMGEYLKRDMRFTTPDILRICPTDEWELNNLYKIVFRQEEAVLTVFRRALLERFGDRVSAFWSGPRSIEVSAPNTSKATALVSLADILERQEGYRRTVIACGDFENDLAMLKAADIAVCPQNAIPAVKEICDYTLCHHTKGLIADIIERLPML